MNFEYSYDRESNRVTTRVSGSLSAGDFVAYCNSVLEDPAIEPGFIETLVLAPSVEIDVTFGELHPFQALWARYLAKGVRGTIILPQSPSAYGIVRMFEAAIASDMADSDVSFDIVTTPDEMESRVAEIRARFPAD